MNPGLTVSAVREGDGELDFERDRQAVLVRRGVGRGDTVRLALEYHGRICPEICYPEVTDLRTVAEYRRHYLFRQGRDYYYLRPDLTILTPECVWYPVSLPPVDVETPMLTQEYYTDFSLSVTGGEGRTVLSQGRMSQKGDTVRFENGQRLPGITLCMGPYTRMARRHGKVLYELYVLKGHEFLVEDKGDPTSLMEFWEKGMQGEYDFPYSKLSVVEAPLHFCAYARQWKSRSEFVQPEILFRPEKEAVTFGPQSTRSASGGEITSLYGWFESYDWLTLRRERGIYNGNFFQDKFAGHYPNPDMRPNEYYPHAIRTPYQIWMYSSSFPGIHLLMDEAMNGLTSDLGEMERSFRCGITDVASILSMRGHSLKEIVNAPSFANVIKLKTKLLFSRLHKVATFQELRTFWEEFYERHNFQAVGYEDFCLEFQRRFGYDLLAITEQMYAEKGLPWFEFKDARVDYMEDMDGEKVYLQQVKVWNRGDVEGVLKICSGGMKDSNYVIPAGASVEIRRVSKNSYAPEQWELQTILAQNIPSVIELNTPPRKVGSLDLREGMFLIDPGEFAEEEGTRVVDDTDEGFCLYSSSGQAMDIPQLQRGRQFPAYEAASSSWGSYYNSQAYGSPVRRYMSKECGNGNVCAVWEWKEAEAGMYEVFVFNNNFAPDDHEPFCVDGEQNGMRGKSRTPVQCYTIAHSDGEETVEVETFNAGFGWVSLGVYFIEHGEAKVTLSDKGAYPHQMIYADAVKWVRL